MSDEINSPGQLRQYEENQGWLPRQSETPTIGAGDGYNGATLPAPEDVKPMTMGRYAQKVTFNKGDYFSHDNKVYYKNPEGKVSLVTGDAMGDVELTPEQTAQLEKERADKAAREKAEKEGPVYTDQVPGGKVEQEQPTDYEGASKLPKDSWFNRRDKDTQLGLLAGMAAVPLGIEREHSLPELP